MREARHRCTGRLALASVPDQETNTFLSSLVTRRRCAWLGGQRDRWGRWGWLDGTPWRYTSWALGEPRHGYRNNRKDFLVLWSDEKWQAEKYMGPKHRYICQYKPKDENEEGIIWGRND